MLATRELNDEWLLLARSVAATGGWPQHLTDRQAEMLTAGAKALPLDLAFPEVFWPAGASKGQSGFDVVLSNPPWDILQPNTAEFFGGYDPYILDATNRHEAQTIQDRLLTDAAVARAWRDYRATFAHHQRLVARLYRHQRVDGDGAVLGGKLDLYRVFAERMLRLLGSDGVIGMVVPSAFHANEGASGLRKLYLQETCIEYCLSFENRRSLFDIHARFRFALVVARRPGPTLDLHCGFCLTDFNDLDARDRWLTYDRDFITASGGAYATLLELRDTTDLALARQMYLGSQKFGPYLADAGIALSREIHMSDDADRFTSLSNRDLAGPDPVGKVWRREYLVLHEGKTIHQFTDRWSTSPRYAIGLSALAGKPMTIESMLHYRAACREIARSTDERTSIATILPPGVLCGHTISVERRPAQRPNAAALSLVAVMNSFAFDWLLRQRASIHVSLYILSELPVPKLERDADRFLCHAALRLCCNHKGFAPLWREQLADAWHEASAALTWPALADVADRWRLRAAMDAIVAHAYGLSCGQYERILASFSDKSYQAAHGLCIAAFEELACKGLADFTSDHDPYCDIPRVTSPARPVIQLPAAAET